MRDFLHRRASSLIGEARQLAAEGEGPEACRRLLATCEFLLRSFGSTHREIPELLQMLSDLYHVIGESREAEYYQTRAWELRHFQERNFRRLLGISRLAEEWTFSSANLERWPCSVQAFVHDIQNNPNSKLATEVIIFGPPRSGKTHLLHALGHEAIHRLWPTRIYLGYEFLESLVQARRSLNFHRSLCRLDRYVTLLIDELDPWNLSQDEAETLHTALVHRRGRRCTMLAIRTEQRFEEKGFLASIRRTKGLRYPSPDAILLGLVSPYP